MFEETIMHIDDEFGGTDIQLIRASETHIQLRLSTKYGTGKIP
jgi:hypothetical protein